MTNNLKISIVVLSLLLIIFFINNNKQNALIIQSNQIFEKNINDIQKILIQKNDAAIELIRIDTTWEILGNDSLIIKERSLESFFDRVLTVNRETLISENPDLVRSFLDATNRGYEYAMSNPDEAATILLNSVPERLILEGYPHLDNIC